MEAVCTSETPVYFKETIQRFIPQRCHLHTRRRENLKSHRKLAVREMTEEEGTPYCSLETILTKDFGNSHDSATLDKRHVTQKQNETAYLWLLTSLKCAETNENLANI
jgi:hypothetical protein